MNSVKVFWRKKTVYTAYALPSKRDGGLSIQQQEALALRFMALMAQRHCQGKTPLRASQYQIYLQTRIQDVGRVLKALELGGLVTEDFEEPPRFLPSAPLENVSVKQVLDAVRNYGDPALLPRRRGKVTRVEVQSVSRAIDQAIEETLGHITVKAMGLKEPKPHVGQADQADILTVSSKESVASMETGKVKSSDGEKSPL